MADFLASLEADEVVLEQRLRDAEARSALELIVGDPGIDDSVVTPLKPDDAAEAEFDPDGVPGLVGAAATNGEALVVYHDY